MSGRGMVGRDVQDEGAGRRVDPAALGSNLGEVAKAAVCAAALAAPVLGLGGWSIAARVRAERHAAAVLVEAGQNHERLVAAAAGPVLGVEEAAAGRELFATVCAACHGKDGAGVPGLGKDLATSDFVAGLDDAALVRFIEEGRPGAKPMPMPPRGGREDLTEGDVGRIAAYVRGLQDPRRMPPLPEVAAAPSAAEKDAALAAAGGDAELAEYIASGNRIYHTSCVACHGKDGAGVAGNGKTLARSAFVAGRDDDALLAFIKAGRSPTDPENTTGIQMPPRGGNPAMTDDDILDVIAYLRTLQEKRANAGK